MANIDFETCRCTCETASRQIMQPLSSGETLTLVWFAAIAIITLLIVAFGLYRRAKRSKDDLY